MGQTQTLTVVLGLVQENLLDRQKTHTAAKHVFNFRGYPSKNRANGIVHIAKDVSMKGITQNLASPSNLKVRIQVSSTQVLDVFQFFSWFISGMFSHNFPASILVAWLRPLQLSRKHPASRLARLCCVLFSRAVQTSKFTYIHPSIHACMHPYITLHYITLHCITLHYIALHCIALHYITLNTSNRCIHIYIYYHLLYIHGIYIIITCHMYVYT